MPNEQGSSHGVTRIIRLAYYEDPSYVPLLRRAYELWRELETAAGERLLHITGSVDAGRPDSFVFEGSVRSCVEHELAHEVIDGAEVNRRFPGTACRPTRSRCSSRTAASSCPSGASSLTSRRPPAAVELRTNERVVEWEPTGSGVRVTTDRAGYEAERLVLSAGAWEGELTGLPVVAERQVLAWFDPLGPSSSSRSGSPSST